MIEMLLPHAPLWPDVHDDADHRTMPPLLPVHVAADPLFQLGQPAADPLVTDLVAAYGPTLAAGLWQQALIESHIGLDPVQACPDCDGHGLIYDHSSPDPQQHWDRTCRRCSETGVIDTTEEAA